MVKEVCHCGWALRLQKTKNTVTQRTVYYNSLRNGEVLKQELFNKLEFLPAEFPDLIQAFGNEGDGRAPVLP